MGIEIIGVTGGRGCLMSKGCGGNGRADANVNEDPEAVIPS